MMKALATKVTRADLRNLATQATNPTGEQFPAVWVIIFL
jgi:hypothetical protein